MPKRPMTPREIAMLVENSGYSQRGFAALAKIKAPRLQEILNGDAPTTEEANNIRAVEPKKLKR